MRVYQVETNADSIQGRKTHPSCSSSKASIYMMDQLPSTQQKGF